MHDHAAGNQPFSHGLRRSSAAPYALLLAFLLLLWPAAATAQAPGSATIEGTISLPGATLSSSWFVSVLEEGSDRSFNSVQTLTGDFSLEVPMGASGTTRVFVRANGRASVAGSASEMVRLPLIPVDLSNGDVVSLDIVEPLALVQGVVPAGDIGGVPVSVVRISTFFDDTEPTLLRDVAGSSVASPGSPWEALALAGAPVRIRRAATTGGSNIYHLEDVVTTLTPGEVLDLGVESLPAAQETFEWEAQLVGPRVFSTVFVSTNTQDSASRLSDSSSLDTNQTGSDTAVSLVAGKHFPLFRFSGFAGYVSVPRAFAPPFEPSAQYSVSLAHATIAGDLVASGTVGLDDVSLFRQRWQEPGERVSDHHAVTGQTNPGRLDYVAQLTQGDWQPTFLNLTLSRPSNDPDGHLKETIQQRLLQSFTVSLDPAEAGTAPDQPLRFGRVLLDLRDPSGVPYPISRVRGWCQRRDAAGDLIEWSEISAFAEFAGAPSMTIELLEGQCELEVIASDGSLLRSDLWVDLDEGDIVAMDLHPPEVTLIEPVGPTCGDGSVRVQGTATDPFGILSVEIGGTLASLTPTGSADPNEVAFDETVPLPLPGLQNVELVAKDLGGAEGLILLPVRNDSGAPTFDLPTSPASTSQATYRLVGQVSDDNVLSEVRLDGVVLSQTLAATYDLDVDLALQPGDNVFVLEAEDICGQLSTERFIVRLVTDTPGKISGGGHVDWPGTEDRATFGFNVRSDGENPKGSFVLVLHAADGRLRVKSDQITSFRSQGSTATFTFDGEYTPARGPRYRRDVTVTVWVEDGGEPGAGADRFWIEVRDEGGTPVPALSLPAPAAAEAVALTGGNIQVKE